MSAKKPDPTNTVLMRVIQKALAAQLTDFSAVIEPLVAQSEMSMSQQLEDLSRDTALAFAELHGKIDYLRSEINEVKQILNSLFR
jgi:TolA-binding protein